MAVSVGSISNRIVSHMRLGSGVELSPATKMAITTTGTTIGDTKNASSARRPGKLPRTMPMAADVPSTVAAIMVGTATLRLVTAVWYHWGDVKKFVYQRTEKLFGGNSMYGVPLKDVIMMIKTGAT